MSPRVTPTLVITRFPSPLFLCPLHSLDKDSDSGDSAKRKCFPAGWNVFPKPCDYCKYAAALLFCSADSAFMCISCDSEVHHYDGNMTAVRHGKVWMCEVCEQAPAAVTCRADNASLCFTCDRDIHSANPLAQRHERAAVVPFYDSAESVMLKSAAGIFSGQDSDEISDGYIPDSWISTDSISTSKLPAAADAPEMKSMEFLLPDYDRFLDCNRFQICSQPYSDSVVPVQTTVEPPLSAQLTHQHSPENQFEIDFTRSSITSYNNSYTSLSHRVPSASIDVGVVPEGSAFVSETSYPFSASSISDPIANHGFPAAGMDREARVLRYREKRKNRKFAKTIRYASRKAYAERRPRIKGRFVKRTDPESDMDEILSIVSGNLIADTCYGVVPSS